MKMVQKVVSVTQPQDEYLRAEAERLGITIADLVRRIIDAHREKMNTKEISNG